MTEVAVQKCARCGNEVDPVRAAVVQLTDEGFVYFCSNECAGGAPESANEATPSPVPDKAVVSSERTIGSAHRTASGSVILASTLRSVDASWELINIARNELKHSTGTGLIALWVMGAILASLPHHPVQTYLLIATGWLVIVLTGWRRHTGVLITLPVFGLACATLGMLREPASMHDASMWWMWLIVVTFIMLRWAADDALRKRLEPTKRSKSNDLTFQGLFSFEKKPSEMGLDSNLRVLLRASGMADGLSAIDVYRSGLVITLALVLLALLMDNARPWLSAAGICLLWPISSLARSWQEAYAFLREALRKCEISGLDDRWLALLGRVKTVVLASPRVFASSPLSLLGIHPLEGEAYEQCLGWAIGAEQTSLDHPLAIALTNHVNERQTSPEMVRRIVVERGRGIKGIATSGEPLLLGSRRLLLEHGVSVAMVEAMVRQSEQEGQTVIYLAVGGRLRAVFRFGAVFESQGRAAVHRLGEMKTDVILLSGDHRETAEVFAKQFDIAHVKAELTSDEKNRVVEQLSESGEIVLLIGSGELDEALYARAPLALSLENLGTAPDEDKPSGEWPATMPGSVWRLKHTSLRQVCEVLYAAYTVRSYRMEMLFTALVIGFLVSLFVVSGYMRVVTAAWVGLTLECYVLWTAWRFYAKHK